MLKPVNHQTAHGAVVRRVDSERATLLDVLESFEKTEGEAKADK